MQIVVKEEADADGHWNKAGGRHGQHFADAENFGEQQAKDDKANSVSYVLKYPGAWIIDITDVWPRTSTIAVRRALPRLRSGSSILAPSST